MSKALVVVDIQKDFIDGALANPVAETAMPTVHEVVKYAAENDFDIYYTQDTHFIEFYANSQEGKKLPVPHCIFHSPGWRIDPRAKVSKANGKITNLIKITFGYDNWADEYMNQYSEIIVIGFCTDICVISNVMLLKANAPEVPIVVIEDACAGTSLENHAAALRVMRCCQVDTMEWGEYNKE